MVMYAPTKAYTPNSSPPRPRASSIVVAKLSSRCNVLPINTTTVLDTNRRGVVMPQAGALRTRNDNGHQTTDHTGTPGSLVPGVRSPTVCCRSTVRCPSVRCLSSRTGPTHTAWLLLELQVVQGQPAEHAVRKAAQPPQMRLQALTAHDAAGQ